MPRRLSESRIVDASLNDRLEEIWHRRRHGHYTMDGVVTEWLNDPAVRKALDEERMAWFRTAGSTKLRKIIYSFNKEDTRQYELMKTVVSLRADYVVPGLYDEEETEEGDPDYHVPRNMLTVDEHGRHVGMRRRQREEDDAVYRRELKLAMILEEVGAGGDERVLDVLARLAAKRRPDET